MANKKRDNVYWVVLERTALFTWKAHSLYSTKKAAEAARKELEATVGFLGPKGFKVDRVVKAD